MIEAVKKEKNISTNRLRIEFEARSENESFARVAVAAFIAPLNPTLEELSDVKTAVSEAVTNAIIHGYDYALGEMQEEKKQGMADLPEQEDYIFGAGRRYTYLPRTVYLNCEISGDVLTVEVEDKGKGIENIERAMEPLFTTKPELERSGMGFAFMEAFMDDLEVESSIGLGTKVRMKKKLGISPWLGQGGED